MKFVPSEFITKGIDAYLAKAKIRFHGIYWLLVLLVVGAIAALPFVFVDVSVQDSGVIRPVAEKTEIKASVTELVDSVYVREGQILSAGDTVLTFIRENPDYRIEYQQKRLNDYEAHLQDLETLAKGAVPRPFQSPTRQQEFSFYLMQKHELETSLAKAAKDFERNKSLFDKKVISGEEYETYRHEFDKATNAVSTLKNNQIRQWQIDLNNYTNLQQEMLAAMRQEGKSKDMYVVLCPVREADTIVALENGLVTEQGTHAQLLENKGVYWKLWNEQNNMID
ncbi:MAG: hypothetical protein LBJ17_08015 [Dysgonamonadaceae bacterium]|jgi:multidrug resistance efflux pump|nr:hypothetical protein [Dysgonamonadaceae bacterium]